MDLPLENVTVLLFVVVNLI